MALPQTPSFDLQGRKALVTGGGRGLGIGEAAALAQAGADVYVGARTFSEVEAVANDINAEGGKATPITLDVTDNASVEAAIRDHGPFQILVNNAGTNRPADVLDTSEEDFDYVHNLNVKSAYFVAKAVAQSLIDAGLPGSIINISSQMGHVGGPMRSVYCSTKHSVEGYTKVMAWEWAKHDIRVNTLAATFIETAMTKSTFDRPGFREFIESRIAFGRVGQLEDIMGAVVFLASDASKLVTGSSLRVDGGWTSV